LGQLAILFIGLLDIPNKPLNILVEPLNLGSKWLNLRFVHPAATSPSLFASPRYKLSEDGMCCLHFHPELQLGFEAQTQKPSAGGFEAQTPWISNEDIHHDSTQPCVEQANNVYKAPMTQARVQRLQHKVNSLLIDYEDASMLAVLNSNF
jgi:hypothetical protein